MDGKTIEDRTQEVFRQVLGQPELVLTADLTARDVAGWDSLAHIQLILALEREFRIRLRASEVVNPSCVGDLIDIVSEKVNK